MRPMLSLAAAAALVCAAAVPALGEDVTPAQGTAGESQQLGTPEQILAGMSLDEKVGQLLWTHVYGASADDASMAAKNQAVFGEDVTTPAQAVAKYHLGGVLYFNWSGNVGRPTNLEQVATLSNGLQEAARGNGARVPLAITIDQEGGIVARITSPATEFPGNMALGATRDKDLARKQGEILGRELRALGINVDFAPTVDVNTNWQNPVIGVRSISSDENLVGELGTAQILGMQSQGVSATAKHFPGHGDTVTDSHLGLPVVTYDRATLNRHLVPFQKAIDAGVDMIMTAHIIVNAVDPEMPGTLSKKVLTDLLRTEMGFKGIITTDALDMEGAQLAVMSEQEEARYRELKALIASPPPSDDPTAQDQYQQANAEYTVFMKVIRGRVAVAALKAGSDILLNVYDAEAVVSAVKAAVADGTVPLSQIDASVLRVLKWKQQRGVLDAAPVDLAAIPNNVGTDSSLATAAQIAAKSLTLLRNNNDAAPFSPVQYPKLLVCGSTYGNPEHLTPVFEEAGFAVTFKTTAKAHPTDAEIAAMVSAAGDVDAVVMTSWNVGTAQEKMVNDVAAVGKPLFLINTRNPYDMAKFDGKDAPVTAVATYSNRKVSLTAAANMLLGRTSPSGKLPVAVPAPDGSRDVYSFGFGLDYGWAKRVAGADRYATSVAALREGSWNNVAVLATGEGYSDALAAAPLASVHGGPVVLTRPGSLDSALSAALKDAKIGRVILAGGTGTLRPALESQLKAAGFTVERVSGANRFATAAALAQRALDDGGQIERVFIADGTDFPDALAAGGAARSAKAVTVLTVNGKMPAETAQFLRKTAKPAVALGGSAARASLPEARNLGIRVTSIVGGDRYETAQMIAQRFAPHAKRVVVTSGVAYPDALSGAALANTASGALLLSAPGGLPGQVEYYLEDNNNFPRAIVVGGTGAVGAKAFDELVAALSKPAQ
ncbi:glycoside hydrolase family 3 N-terminal domain-containing protein [Buchananella felis]|uniref:glycoside hydrolase family 3 N-terminal domain-containing protein n=1 Tax=Buchananella felis TaxID=3231492 RepID=UPI003528F7F7